LILSAGDFVNGHSDKTSLPIEEIAMELAKAQAKYEFYTVLGNHDSWYGKEQVTKAPESNTIKILSNSNAKIRVGQKAFYIAGVEDLTTGEPIVRKVLDGVEQPGILLTHNPDIFLEIPDSVNLILAGHTHGGQVVLPLVRALIVPSKKKYAQGMIEENGRKMFVTRGIGTSIFPIRFNCKPEIVVIEFE
jgi:predicted MPP superfamily phosphohydrolase